MKMLKFDLFKKVQNFLFKYNIIFNYYFLSITFLVIFTFILIRIIGSNVLKHEEYILKTEFIKQHKRYTKDIADKIVKYFENLDTLSIIDLINKAGKEDDAAYAYVLNQNKEVIAHTEPSEILKKYKDNFINDKYLKHYVKNISKVWHKEKKFKDKPIIRFTMPIILQFAKDNTFKELDRSSYNDDDLLMELDANDMDSLITNTELILEKEHENNKEFGIVGVFHIAFFSEKLDFISKFSYKQVRIYYIISYILAVLFGFFIGKYLENSFKLADSTLVSLIKEIRTEEINTGLRIDTFKKLFMRINQFVTEYKEISDRSQQDIKDIDRVYDILIPKLCDNLKDSIIITNKHLKVDFINKQALSLLNKKEIIKENINEVLAQYMMVVDEINKVVASGKDKVYCIQTDNKNFNLIPLFIDNSLKKFIIIITDKSKIKGKYIVLEKKWTQREKEGEKTSENTAKGEKKKTEDIKNKISSRLKDI